MIQIPKIIPPTAELYNSDNVCIGVFNEYEILDIRVQIKETKASGYYLKFNGKKIRIDIRGGLESYPNGLFDTMTNSYMKLID